MQIQHSANFRGWDEAQQLPRERFSPMAGGRLRTAPVEWRLLVDSFNSGRFMRSNFGDAIAPRHEASFSTVSVVKRHCAIAAIGQHKLFAAARKSPMSGVTAPNQR
jgi:hypothetical protein